MNVLFLFMSSRGVPEAAVVIEAPRVNSAARRESRGVVTAAKDVRHVFARERADQPAPDTTQERGVAVIVRREASRAADGVESRGASCVAIGV